jgi:four helix bundle protein
MPDITSFRDLIVWQKSMTLAERCYRMSKRLGRDDQSALGVELRRTCISVPSNIAEGFGRHYTSSYINHLWIANASNNELQTQLELAGRVNIIGAADIETLIADAEEVGRMIRGLVAALERSSPRNQ